jgi:isoquinoline 1-oxidoreductase alpha subunit
MAIKLNINGENREVDVAPETPLLWVLRDVLGMTGTKYGCGIQHCGACTVHVDGVATRSCGLAVGDATGAITTIEGLGANGAHPLQVAWAKENVPQCGYCQPGQLMTAAALLKENPHPSEVEIEEAMSGNICRCGTYTRIRAAVKLASESI